MEKRRFTYKWVIVIGMFFMCSLLSGCVKDKETGIEKESSSFLQEEKEVLKINGNGCTISSGILYKFDGMVSFFDFATKKNVPICIRPDCNHEKYKGSGSSDCTGALLSSQALYLGLYQNQLYYIKSESGTSASLYKADVDGENTGKIGSLPYGMLTTGDVLMFNNKMYLDTFQNQYDKEGKFSGIVESSLIEVDIESGKYKEILPKKELEMPAYQTLGIYDNWLFYADYSEENGKYYKKYNLETKKIDFFEPTEEKISFLSVNGDKIVYGTEENGKYGITLYFAKEGKEEKIGEKNSRLYGAFVFQKEIVYYYLDEKDPKKSGWNVYHIETKESQFLQMSAIDQYMIPEDEFGDYYVGAVGQDKGYIKKEDFIRGKKNWTIFLKQER